ncbi:MAG TPA: thioredoxin [Desulfitobacteriaceae bacterium]|jgi:thioredoxin 1|nr:thioredoxin [Desulfitobacteriaceae bacterium]
MSGANVKTFSAANWEQDVIGSETPVLVDFWAPWCGPCRMVAPVVEQLADEYAGRIAIGKLNVDENGSLASQFGIMSIPTLGIFKDGKMVDKVIGFSSKANLTEMLNKYA